MNSIKNFLRSHRKVIIFSLIFLVGFAFGWFVQVERVYNNCVKWTEGNPACEMYRDYF